jgi:hypothetical protein
VSLTIDDLTPFASNITPEKASAMIATAMARAARVAPCIREDALSDDNAEAAKGVIRDAILRWHEAGSGALASQTVGPFGMTTDSRQQRKALFWPSEIDELQAICADHNEIEAPSSGAFSIRPSGSGSAHMPWCSLMLGAAYCSCGADLTNGEYPLYDGGVLSTGDDY